jgi:outer membrane protein OmpA-like peptidoglycan-associated protein/ABC-type nitrate/sulfonate/bicarbonate transport system substrate-binding protein
MGDRSAKGILAAAAIWVVIIGLLAVAAKIYILPYFQEELEQATGSASPYQHDLVLAADSFSGYCVFRSAALKNDLKPQGIRLTIRDDKADIDGRMKALRDRKIQLAVFTIDSFIAAGQRLGQYPGSIVMVVDETSGADAIVSYKSAVASLQDLDSPEGRLVLTPNSPSEFLARTVIAHFNLPSLPEKWWLEAKGAEDVYRQFIAADKTAKRAFVLWEPYVSKALEAEGAQLLLDSSRLKGYIVDVLVAERSFLSEQPALVRAVVEAYFRSAYAARQKPGGMAALVMEDAGATGSEKLSPRLAEKLVAGIDWKNTLENYALFGLLPEKDARGQLHIEDVIANITAVLVKTGTLPADPLEGRPQRIFYDKTLKEMQAAQFHPGRKLAVVEGLGPGAAGPEALKTGAELRPLTDAEWDGLAPVGRLRVPPLAFARGTARMNIQSERELNELVRQLNAWPGYYLVVMGHARSEGDAEANLRLARERAQAAADFLLSMGISAVRVRVRAAAPTAQDASAQSVSFGLYHMPY